MLKILYIWSCRGLLAGRPTLPASLLISAHIASRAGRLLAITNISSAYPQICVSLFKIVCALFQVFQCFVENEDKRSRKCVIPVVCIKLGKRYLVKHNCVTIGVFSDYNGPL